MLERTARVARRFQILPVRCVETAHCEDLERATSDASIRDRFQGRCAGSP